MPKSTTWQSPLVTRNFKTPTGPLAECDPGMCYDFTNQRKILPEPMGSKNPEDNCMNRSCTAAHAIVTSLDSNGTESPFSFPK
jgi:hypothetical protein